MLSFKQFMIEARQFDNDVIDLHRKLIEHYVANKEQKNSVRFYTGEGDVNAYIHSFHHKDKPVHRFQEKYTKKSKVHEDHIRNLDKLTNTQKTPKSFHVYAATRFNPLEHKDKTLHSRGFLSTTIDSKVARGFAYDPPTGDKPMKHILKIHVPKDHPGAYVAHHSHPAYSHQKEFVLPRDTRIKVKKSEPSKDGRFTIHHASIIRDVKESSEDTLHIHNLNHKFVYEIL